MKDATRATGVVGLIARNEFAAVLLGVNADQARPVVEKVRASLEGRLPGLVAAAGLKTPPLVAIGASVYGEDADSPDVLVDRARRSLRRQLQVPPRAAAHAA